MNMTNPGRIRKALANLKDAVHELEAALADAERPRPDPLPAPVSLKRSGTRRRV